jgi:hypothetical protein
MALLDPPECFQSEVALNLVHNLLRWGAPAFTGRIHVDASPHNNLAAGEFVLFVSNLSNLVFLRAAAGGARPPTSAPYALLHSSGGHHRLPLQDVRGGDASSSNIRRNGCCAATFRRRKAS